MFAFTHDDGTITKFGLHELAFLFQTEPKRYDKFIMALQTMGVIGHNETIDLNDKVFDIARQTYS